jgi:transposase
MRGLDERTSSLFSYVDLEDRVPANHPLRLIRRIVNDVPVALDGDFAKIYADSGRPSIPPERLLRALRLQTFYTIRSETQLMEQLHYNLLYRWFVGLASTSRCGSRPCSRRTASGCWKRRLPTSSWPSF